MQLSLSMLYIGFVTRAQLIPQPFISSSRVWMTFRVLVLTMRRVRTHLGRNDMVYPLVAELIIAKDGDDESEEGDELGLHGLYSNEVLEVSRGHFAKAIASIF